MRNRVEGRGREGRGSLEDVHLMRELTARDQLDSNFRGTGSNSGVFD